MTDLKFFSIVILALGVGALGSSEAHARPGLYLKLGPGFGVTDGETVEQSRVPDLPAPTLLSTESTSSFGGVLRLGFNFFGYAALEANVSGQSASILGGDDTWLAAWHLGVRANLLWPFHSFLPRWAWDIEPTFGVGLGMSWHGYTPPFDDQVGWLGVGSVLVSGGVDYHATPWLNFGVAYDGIFSQYNQFLYDLSDNEIFNATPSVGAKYHRVLLTIGFHVDLPGKYLENERKKYFPEPEDEEPLIEAVELEEANSLPDLEEETLPKPE